MHAENIWKLKGTTKWVLEIRTQNPDGTWTKSQTRHASKMAARQASLDIRSANSQKAKKAKKVTILDLIKPYAEYKANYMREGTVGAYIHLLNLYVIPEFGKRQPSELTKPELTTWMQKLSKRGLTPSTTNTIRARFLDLLKYAKHIGLIEKNPLEDVAPHRAQTNQGTKVCQPWSLEEAKTALAAFSRTPLDVFVSLALSTGMRKGEILALKWSDLDFKNGTVRVNKSRGEKRVLEPDGTFKTIITETPTKTASSNRTLELHEIVLDAIESIRENNDLQMTDKYLVSGSNGRPMSPGQLHKQFRATCEKNEIRRIRIHDLRHTAAVIGLISGAALEEVSQGLGHSGIDITKRIYAPVVPILAARFTKKIGDALAS